MNWQGSLKETLSLCIRVENGENRNAVEERRRRETGRVLVERKRENMERWFFFVFESWMKFRG